jgi:hypothetical protein
MYPSHSLTSLSSSAQDFSSFVSEPQPKKPLLVLTLSIGSAIETLNIFDEGDLEGVARGLAAKHNLKEEFVDYLKEQLGEQIERELRKRKKGWKYTKR